jgi:hypothetical protein
MLHLYLQQAWDPTMLAERECGVCDVPFEVGTVHVVFVYDGDCKRVCPSCIEYLGKRNPEKYLTIEEFEEAKKRCPEPLWASVEDLVRADPWGDWTGDASRVDRESLR